MLLLNSHTAHGQEQRYRVELLVLRHLEGNSASEPILVLRDFSAAMDLLEPRQDGAAQEPADSPALQAGLESGAQAGVQAGIPGGDQPQPPIVLMETQSEVMQQAWRRLHSANGLRPELYMSWEQAASAGSPVMRIHDQDLLFEQDPNASQQDAAAFQQVGAASDEPTGDNLAPGLLRYYRLDGTARLRVSRFLHLDLDIEFREPADPGEQTAATQPSTSTQAIPGQAGPDTPAATAWTVYAIRQSRQFQIQDMQYFDGPVISVLALVSRVEPLPLEVQ